MQIRIRHWFAALSVAALTHAGFVMFFYESSPSLASASGIGLNGIEISLGPAGGAPGVAKTETATTETIADVQQLDKVKVERQRKVESKAMAQAKRAPRAAPTVNSRSKQKLTHTSKPVTQAAVETSVSSSEQQTMMQGSDGISGTKNQQETGQVDTGSRGGVPGSKRDYFALLSAWFEKHKQYPLRAQRRRQEGTVYLRFVIDRLGNVLSYKIEHSSGHELLDREIKKMIQRAAPLPSMPSELMTSRLELVIPISFYMR